MSNTYTARAPFPPVSQAVGVSASGTITNIACNGPCTASIYSASGSLLWSVSSQAPINTPVSLAFSGGAPVVKQTTPSDIVVTI
jgi:hypothetical protein